MALCKNVEDESGAQRLLGGYNDVDEQTNEKIFGTKSNNNIAMFGGSSNTVIKIEVYNNADDNYEKSTGVQAASNNAAHTVYYDDAIDIT